MQKELISDFLEHYSREYDHFSELARIVERRIAAGLAKHGILAIVTSRAKTPGRLRDKVRSRESKSSYDSVQAIYADIIDLAGVRVALYFPSDREKLAGILQELFELLRDPKSFPESNKLKIGKRFSGYHATHYLVTLKAEHLDVDQKRFAGSRVEVQVASVLMHGWAEVEHDLQYKPTSGNLSDDELAILDELNGLVLSGEIALERLQRAVERRIASAEFENQYELAVYLSQLARQNSFSLVDVGKVDVLFRSLKTEKRANAKGLAEFVKTFTDEEKQRPISDVIMDKVLLSEDASAASLAKAISKELVPIATSSDASSGLTVESFLSMWKEIEHLLRSRGSDDQNYWRSFGLVLKDAELTPDLKAALQEARYIRNQLVHSLEPPPDKKLDDVMRRMNQLLPVLRRKDGSSVK